DAMPGAFICSGSLRGSVDNADVIQMLKGKRPIRKLFTKEQRALYEEYAPPGLDLDSLTAFGPINVAKLKLTPRMLRGRLVVAELWFYPDGSRLLELSTKCACEEAWRVLEEMRTFLTRHGVNMTTDQQTKTRKALEYFAQLHRTPAAELAI